MKNIFIIITVIGLVFTNSGCRDWLDVRPESEVILEDFWKNETQAQEVLAACYNAFTEEDVTNRLMIWGELRSDNIIIGDGMDADMVRMLNFDINSSNQYCTWGPLYRIINYCNTFLYYAPGVVKVDENFTESKLHGMEAEVLALRALAYFYLVRTFKEVPYITTPSIEDTQDYRVAKSSEEDILSNLIVDLKYALRYGREKFEFDNHTKGRVTKNMIRCLLADIYLWQEDYQNCIANCNDILADNSLEFVDGEDVLIDVFYRGNSTESIFELQFDEINNPNKTVYNYLGGEFNEAGAWAFPYNYVDENSTGNVFNYKTSSGLEGANDLRKKQFIWPAGDIYFALKYAAAQVFIDPDTDEVAGFVSARSKDANWIIYRLSDVILMKAEALVNSDGDTKEVMRLVNTTFLRANPDLQDDSLKIDDYNSKFELNRLILRERQRELLFEGKRWFDLLRLARRDNSPSPLLNFVARKFSGSSINTAKISVMDALYLPIHSREIDTNSALVQNPYYEVSDEGDITKEN